MARKSRAERPCCQQVRHLVGRIRLGREDQFGQLVLQATAGYGQAVWADFLCCVTVTQIQASPERLG
jgi:hypothetical protein